MNPQKQANCCVLGDGSGSGDHAHVSKRTPLQTKKKEMTDDLSFKGDAIDRDREKATTKARRGGNVRPLDGGNAV